MIRRFTVTGDSMLPHYRAGDVVLMTTWLRPHVGSVVVARDPRDPDRRILKRITAMNGDHITVTGDNPSASTDSRTFGSIRHDDILGIVIYPRTPSRILDKKRV